MVSRVRVTVMSVSSSRAMRLRSRAGVAGSFQIAGRCSRLFKVSMKVTFSVAMAGDG